MAHQPPGQVAVDYCAIVIYGLCHRSLIFYFFFQADLFHTKTIQFAVDSVFVFLLLFFLSQFLLLSVVHNKQ